MKKYVLEQRQNVEENSLLHTEYAVFVLEHTEI